MIDNRKENKSKEKEEIKVDDARVWKHRYNLDTERIISKIGRSQTNVKNNIEIFNEEERNFRRKKKIKNISSVDGQGNRNNADYNISNNVRRIMSEAGKLVMQIKQTADKDSINNIESLMTITRNIQHTDIIPEPNKIMKIKEKEYHASLEGKIKKAPNYRFLSDNCRKQVNKAFNNYSPMIHLRNYQKLRQTNPETEKDYLDHLKEINNELKYEMNPNFHRDRYEESLKEKSIELENQKQNEKNKSSKKSITLSIDPQTEETDCIDKSSKHKTINQKNSSKKKPVIRRQKVEIRRKLPEKREVELGLMYNVLNKINTCISDDNIKDYLSNYYRLKGTTLDEQKHAFFGGMRKAEKLLTEIQSNLYVKKTEDDANNKKRIVTNDNDAFVERIGVLKNALLNEIKEQENRDGKLIGK